MNPLPLRPAPARCLPGLCRLLAGLSLCFVQVWAGDTPSPASVVWKADFTTGPTLEAAGWTTVGGEGVSTWQLRDGGLAMSFGPKPYKGGYLAHPVPFAADADLVFEVTTGLGQGGYDHFSLKLDYGGMCLSFKNTASGHKLLRYWKAQWAEVCGEVPLGKRTKIRVQFTPAENGLVQYFVDDMQSPAFAEEGVVLLAPTDPAVGNQFRIGNYGLSSGLIGHTLHSFELRKGVPPGAPKIVPAPQKKD